MRKLLTLGLLLVSTSAFCAQLGEHFHSWPRDFSNTVKDCHFMGDCNTKIKSCDWPGCQFSDKMDKTRCTWCTSDPLYIEYHDNEWGKPVYDDKTLFEFLILEGAQAGLSWITILKRRKGYRAAFDDFDVHKIAKYDQQKFDQLMQNEAIIRNRLKIKSAISNAQQVLALYDEGTTLSDYLWNFVDGKPIINDFKTLDELPAKTELSDQLSKALKKRGFSFVGSTICYAFMQAVGMVNDHTQDCFQRLKADNPFSKT